MHRQSLFAIHAAMSFDCKSGTSNPISWSRNRATSHELLSPVSSFRSVFVTACVTLPDSVLAPAGQSQAVGRSGSETSRRVCDPNPALSTSLFRTLYHSLLSFRLDLILAPVSEILSLSTEYQL